MDKEVTSKIIHNHKSLWYFPVVRLKLMGRKTRFGFEHFALNLKVLSQSTKRKCQCSRVLVQFKLSETRPWMGNKSVGH